MIQIPDKKLSRADYARLASEVSSQTLGGLNAQRLAVLGSTTTEFFNPFLIVEAARFGISLEIWNGPYGHLEQQVLNPDSDLFQFNADVLLLLPDLEYLSPTLAWSYLSLAEEECDALEEEIVDRLSRVLEAVQVQRGMRILLGNLAPPAWWAAGRIEPMLENSLCSVVQSINAKLAKLCRTVPGACIFDLHGLSCEIGWRNWRDERMALLARAPSSSDAMIGIANLVARHLRSWSVPTKKCLVLDLDNTIWGGVVGEVGLEGIELGAEYPGNAFMDFQRRVLALRDRGILLAAASKNNVADVEEVFSSHSSCLIKREDFSAFEVHWEDKATSLRRISETLNIGLESIVFFDDNPRERSWVRKQLPMVTTIEVPANPMLYGNALEESLSFDAFTLTEEDRKRGGFYQVEKERRELLGKTTSLDEYIRSLEMVVTLGNFDDRNLPRIAQLVGKTNQFNLTTRRHDEGRLREMLKFGAIGIWARVEDRFGDNGLVGVGLAVPERDHVWRIDLFLMSCRVIGRSVETVLLAGLERLVHRRGGREIQGEFLATKKNLPAADLFQRHGYRFLEDSKYWYLPLDELRPLPDSFKIVDLTIA